ESVISKTAELHQVIHSNGLTLIRMRAENPARLSPLNSIPRKEAHPMANLSGSFTGHIRSQSALAVPDQPGHDVVLAEVAGTQKSADPNCKSVSLNEVGTSDRADGKGTQRGYVVHVRADGGSDWGTFEGKVSTVNGLLTVEGTYQETGGTGKFKGTTGKGPFKTRMASPRDVE